MISILAKISGKFNEAPSTFLFFTLRKQAFGVFFSQLIRYARINSNFQSFKDKSRGLVERLVGQGYKVEDLRRLSLRFYRERSNILLKYNLSNGNDFIKDLFH